MRILVSVIFITDISVIRTSIKTQIGALLNKNISFDKFQSLQMEISSLTSRFVLSNASTAVIHAPLSLNICDNSTSHMESISS